MSENVGRARGRGRGQPRGSGGPGSAGGGRGGGPAPSQPPPHGAWGPPPQQQQQRPGPSQHQQQASPRAPAPAPAGRARTVDLVKPMAELSVGGGDSAGGAATGPASRGNMRGGGRQIPDVTYLKTRPESANSKKGTTGTPIKLLTNYFKINTTPQWCLYMYRVDISPPEDRTMVRRSLMRDHRAKIGGYIFDGTVLYTSNRLNPDPMDLYSSRKEDQLTMKLTLKLVGDVAPGDHHYLQVFNILMRRCYDNLQLELIGRDFFDPRAKIEIREYKLQIWPGYKTTINQYEHSILMVAEITHKVVRMDTVLDVLKKYNTRSTYKDDFSAEVVGAVVLTDYNNKTYTVDDVHWNVHPSSTFNYKGENTTYIKYYQSKYQLTIRDMGQPLLVSKAKMRDVRAGMPEMIYLVPEFCRMTGLTQDMRSNFRLMREMANHTRVPPQQRMEKLMHFNNRLNKTEKAVNDMREWNMSIDNKLVEIIGRQLPQETIFQGRQSEVKYPSGDTNEGWTRELRSKSMLSCATVARWVVMVPQRMRREVEGFVQMIVRNGSAMGFMLPPPTYVEIPNDSIIVYMDKLEQVIAQLNPNVILCAVTNERSDRYSAIKKKCYVDRAVPTQVITGRCIANKSAMSIATKVAIQINCKVGGAPWTVAVPLSNIMVVGYDVCHDAGNKSKSYGSMVASLDKAMSRYFSTVTPHTNGEELSNEFGLNIKKALHKYKTINNVLPTHILIYRDGVGEGQIPYVYTHEVEVIKRSLSEVYNGPNYKLGFIIVSKRLNTRFIVANGFTNPKPGTVIDDVVTSPERYDFFLVSQAVRDGTVSPTSYNIIYDTLGLNPDQVQRLTYKFCHTYYNFSGQVRVPAPCQYAHKLAFMTGQHLHLSPNSGLESLLYFL